MNSWVFQDLNFDIGRQHQTRHTTRYARRVPAGQLPFPALETKSFSKLWKALRSLLNIQYPGMLPNLAPAYPMDEVLQVAQRLHWENSVDDSMKLINPNLNLPSPSRRRSNTLSSKMLEMLPIELIYLVLKHLSQDELRALALLSSAWHIRAAPSLWQGFTIEDSEGPDESHLRHRLNALTRCQMRMQSLRRLAIGPCTWHWSPPLLKAMAEMWKNTPRLSDLFLEIPEHERFKKEGHFAALFLTLVESAAYFRLTTLKAEARITDDSPFRQFIWLQPSIRCLIGAFIHTEYFQSPNPTDFLPDLAILHLHHHSMVTAAALVPGRPVRELWLKSDDYIALPAFEAGFCALQRSTVPLMSLSIDGSPGDHRSPLVWLQRLQTTFPHLEHFNLHWPVFYLNDGDPPIFLEDLRTLRLHVSGTARKRLIESLSLMKKLRVLYVIDLEEQMWVRSSKLGPEPEWRLETSKFPYFDVKYRRFAVSLLKLLSKDPKLATKTPQTLKDFPPDLRQGDPDDTTPGTSESKK
ncbi:hypothetical protein DL93DRAFT_2206693 [Clavulina sp. PMI_390]|nr:hypothetical protein DL93DRAFT_2206693 [Clavulina sp. PMI_390]